MSTAMQIKERVVTSRDIALNSLEEVMSLGRVLAASGYFSEARDAGQAVVKILAGRELGFPPITSMTGIYIVKGKVSLSANLMASAIKRSGKYNYKVQTLTDECASIDFYENGQFVGNSTFTTADAMKAGLAKEPNYQRYPRNMIFSRALSNGVKWYCPDLGGGAPIYESSELGLKVDGETGEVIESERPKPTTPVPEFTAADLAQFVEKVAGGYEVMERDEIFTVTRNQSGLVLCNCEEPMPCVHFEAVKLYTAAQKAQPAPEPVEVIEEEPTTPHFENEAHQAAFDAQAPAENSVLNKSEFISLCGLTKELEKLGVPEADWRKIMERVTGATSRKQVIRDDFAKLMNALSKEHERIEAKLGKKAVKK